MHSFVMTSIWQHVQGFMCGEESDYASCVANVIIVSDGKMSNVEELWSTANLL